MQQTAHPEIAAIGRALPPNYYSSETLSAALWNEWNGPAEERARFVRIHRSAGVGGRHLALPLDAYRSLDSFGASNAAWITAATDLGAEAVDTALRRAGLRPTDVDHLFIEFASESNGC